MISYRIREYTGHDYPAVGSELVISVDFEDRGDSKFWKAIMKLLQKFGAKTTV